MNIIDKFKALVEKLKAGQAKMYVKPAAKAGQGRAKVRLQAKAKANAKMPDASVMTRQRLRRDEQLEYKKHRQTLKHTRLLERIRSKQKAA